MNNSFVSRNIVSRFFLRVFITILILFLIVILDKFKYININNIQEKLNYNINFINVFNKYLGVQTKEEDTEVFNEIYLNEVDIDNGVRRYVEDEHIVLSEVNGYIYKIEYSSVYSIYILTDNNIIYKYSNMYSIDVSIYKEVKINDCLGIANSFYERCIYEK